MTTKQNIEKVLWNACDSFRGKIDSSRYKDYILSMLFVKYLSDVYAYTRKKYSEQYNGNEERIARAMSRERFVMDKTSTFDYLYENRNYTAIGEKINIALANIEKNNSAKLHNVFRAIDFNSTVDFGEVREKNAILKNLLEDFKDLDLSPDQLDNADIIGDAYEYMIGEFATMAGKKAGSFFTPQQVSEIMAQIVAPKENDRVYDPTCGSGSLLIRAARKGGFEKVQMYGQERNSSALSMARMNMFIHGIKDANIKWGDTLANPQHLDGDGNLMKFDCIVANMPFSLDKWASGFNPGGEVSVDDDEADNGKKKAKKKEFKMEANLDRWHRFDMGVPPASKGDWAFLLHMIGSMSGNGRIAAVAPHGVLFRGASEGRIRQTIVEKNLVDAVIGLPENLFYGTSIPACIIVFRKGRTTTDVLFVDASKEFKKDKAKNVLEPANIAKIVETYQAFRNGGDAEIEKYSHVATLDEIVENEYNLNISRYVDTFEEEEIINIDEVNAEIAELKTRIAEVEKQMAKYLEELGLN